MGIKYSPPIGRHFLAVPFDSPYLLNKAVLYLTEGLGSAAVNEQTPVRLI